MKERAMVYNYNTYIHAYIFSLTVVSRKRTRCGDCDGCAASECRKCRYCCDKPKYGGKGVLKQCCILRKCKRLRLMCDGKYKTKCV